jgi:putative ABC transport system substrate-binding protein
MRRREFIAGIGGVAAAWPIAAKAQKPKIPVVGFLESGSATYASYAAAFHAGLKETGFVEGQNVNVEYRWAEAQYDRLPALFADLVDRQVTVIVASGAGSRSKQSGERLASRRRRFISRCHRPVEFVRRLGVARGWR